MDDASLETIKKRLQKQLSGNGYNPKAVTIDVLEEGEYSVAVNAYITLDAKLEKLRKSDKNIHPIEISKPDQASRHIEQKINQAAEDSGFKEMIGRLYNNLQGGVVSHDDLAIGIPDLSDVFHLRETCGSCHGKTSTICNTCHGQKQEHCKKCHGRRQEGCWQCKGTGIARQADGSQTHCTYCHARGFIPCTYCHGQGFTACNACAGQGAIQCSTCKGAGTIDAFFASHYTATAKTVIDINSIDDTLKREIDRVGLKTLVLKGDIKLVPQMPDENVSRETSALALHYTFPLTYSKISVSIGKTAPREGFIIGQKQRVIGLKPFFLKPLRDFLSIIEQKPLSPKDAEKALFDFSKYRFFKDALALVFEKDIKKALGTFFKRYPECFNKKDVPRFFKALQRGVRKSSQNSSFLGLGIASVFTVPILLLWQLLGGSNIHLQDINLKGWAYLFGHILCDLGALLMAIIIGTLTDNIAQKLLLKNKLRSLGVKQIKHIPGQENDNIILSLIILLSFALMNMLATETRSSWVTSLLNLL